MMAGFDGSWWNLSQAEVWVTHRDPVLVDKFSGDDGSSLAAWEMYPSMDPRAAKEPISPLQNLLNALINGDITATGVPADGSIRAEIPTIAWLDLTLRPPRAIGTHRRNAYYEPWLSVLVRGADARRHWRSLHETSGRTKFDWPAIQLIYERMRQENPSMSDNNIIEEVQLEYADKFNRSAPSRTTIQKHVSRWRQADKPAR